MLRKAEVRDQLKKEDDARRKRLGDEKAAWEKADKANKQEASRANQMKILNDQRNELERKKDEMDQPSGKPNPLPGYKIEHHFKHSIHRQLQTLHSSFESDSRQHQHQLF